MRQRKKYRQRWKKAWISPQRMRLMLSLFILAAGIGCIITNRIPLRGFIFAVCVFLLAFLWNKRYKTFEMPERNHDDGSAFIRFRLNDIAAAFRKLSRIMGEETEKISKWTEDEKNQAFSAVTEKMCAECGRMEQCWEKEYYDTCHSAYTLVSAVADQGLADKSQVPAGFRHRCIHMDDFLQETKRTLQAMGSHRIWRNRFRENRLAYASQIGEVASVMEDLALEFSERRADERKLSDRIMQKTVYRPIKIKKCIVSNEGLMGKRQKVYLMVKARGRQKMPIWKLAEWVSNLSGQRFVPEKDTPDYIDSRYHMVELVEDTGYRVLCGKACHTKEKSDANGDSYAMMHLDSGQVVLMLSDGMGSGVKAQKDSAWLVGLLEQMVDTGFGQRSALRMINALVMYQEERDMFSSMDLTVVDLYNGMCDFIKVGAASTFIKRGNQVECVTSGSLPMGVFPEMDCENMSRHLMNGDVIVMVTDGVIHHFPHGNDSVCALLSQMDVSGPNTMAAEILNETLNLAAQAPQDDLTVLVCIVCKKSASML